MNSEYGKEEKKEEKKDAKAAPSARLGREAKIGVAVILLLLLVFVGVVVRRLTRSNPVETPAIADNRESEKERFKEEKKEEKEDRYAKNKLFGGLREPTIVVPARLPSERPANSATDPDPAKRMEKEEAKARSSIALVEPPAPEPPKQRYPAGSPDKREAEGARPLREAGNEASLVPPVPELRPRQAETGAASGFVTAESARFPARPPESSRYGDPAISEPPPQAPPQYPAAAPVASYLESQRRDPRCPTPMRTEFAPVAA